MGPDALQHWANTTGLDWAAVASVGGGVFLTSVRVGWACGAATMGRTVGLALRHCLVALLLCPTCCATESATSVESKGVEPSDSVADDVDAALNVVNTLIHTAAESEALSTKVGWPHLLPPHCMGADIV